MAANKWTIVSCQCNLVDEDTCSWLFFQNEATGLEVETLTGNKLLIKASFSPKHILSENIQDLQSQFKRTGLDRVSATLKAEELSDQDWLSNWKKYFIPFSVGESFVICPPWESVGSKELCKRKKIIIDPAMAFGTGQHVTTGFCLHAVDKWAKGPNILDVGTGSGVLAIACALLIPSPHIVALDIDDNAIANAQHNIDLNKVQEVIDLKQSDPKTIKNQTFDTIFSNLTAQVIVDLLPIYNQLLKPHGILVLAGIIEERMAVLERALSQYKWQELEKKIEKGWVGIVLRKDSA